MPIDRSPDSGTDVSARADSSGKIVNAMSVDVEEYFQVSAFAPNVDLKDWDAYESRVELSIDRLLALFSEHDARCTFFTLGWIAERHKAMIRRIVDAGHELASHGYCHRRATDQTPDQFRDDIRKTKLILEDVGGCAITGYRAASFSFNETNPWVHEILADEGHSYSSSIYPVRHDHYGLPDAPRFPFKPLQENNFLEFPRTTTPLFGRNIPSAGGGYFRLFPYGVSRWAMRRVNDTEGQATVFYFHPWEIDPDQPRPSNVNMKTRFRHYVNLNKMEEKLGRALSDFAWDRMDRVLFSANG
jgi:polysaccharide deacetylase family protein (PEP-CTERM system associated)